MLEDKINVILSDINNWSAPAVTADMPKGDMPGDKIAIGEDHIKKASKIFPKLIKLIADADSDKVVVSVFGGSGVGKSETASLLAHYLKAAGIGVAMGNALESLKAVADYTTTSVDEDGIQQALRHFQLI